MADEGREPTACADCPLPHGPCCGAFAEGREATCIACGHPEQDHSLSWSRCTRCNCSGMTPPAREATSDVSATAREQA